MQFVLVAATTERPVELSDHRFGLLAALLQVGDGPLGLPPLALGAMESAGQEPEAGLGLLEVVDQLVAAFQQAPQDGTVEKPGPMGRSALQFDPAYMGGPVDPVRGETLGEGVSSGLLTPND